MITTTATRVTDRYVHAQAQDFSLICGQQDKCSVGTQDVVLLIESKIGEVQSLEFEQPVNGSNRVPWVARMVDGRVIEGHVQINLTTTREEVRAWAEVGLAVTDDLSNK